MTGFEAVVLGSIQGLTEFLPVSSSGHLVLAQKFFGLTNDTFAFDVFLHFATIIAVIGFFWKDIWNFKKENILPIIVASIPAGVIGVLFHKQLENMFSADAFIGVEFLITAAFNFWSERLLRKEKPEIQAAVPLKAAWTMGGMQALAIIPAISRSGSTVLGGLLSGLDRKTAFTFSFLMSIPAILGANVLEFHNVWKSGEPVPPLNLILIGCAFSFVLGLASLFFFKYVMTKAKLQWFGWYCAVLGLILIAWPLFSK